MNEKVENLGEGGTKYTSILQNILEQYSIWNRTFPTSF